MKRKSVFTSLKIRNYLGGFVFFDFFIKKSKKQTSHLQAEGGEFFFFLKIGNFQEKKRTS